MAAFAECTFEAVASDWLRTWGLCASWGLIPAMSARGGGIRGLLQKGMQMAKRPQIFEQQAFQESLRRQGCVESFVGPITSDFRLFVPIALRHLGEEGLFQLMNSARDELKLREQDAAWQVAAKYIVGWAQEQIEAYKEQKL
jgi:hypothetical protein